MSTDDTPYFSLCWKVKRPRDFWMSSSKFLILLDLLDVRRQASDKAKPAHRPYCWSDIVLQVDLLVLECQPLSSKYTPIPNLLRPYSYILLRIDIIAEFTISITPSTAVGLHQMPYLYKKNPLCEVSFRAPHYKSTRIAFLSRDFISLSDQTGISGDIREIVEQEESKSSCSRILGRILRRSWRSRVNIVNKDEADVVVRTLLNVTEKRVSGSIVLNQLCANCSRRWILIPSLTRNSISMCLRPSTCISCLRTRQQPDDQNK